MSNLPIWRHQVERDGFALVEGVLDESAVVELHAAVSEVLCGPSHADLLRDPAGHVRKITYPLALDPRFLLAVADPAILHLAMSVSSCPEELVLTWEDVLYKAPFVGEAVPVHQDLALQSLPGPVYSLGVHLDDATENPIWFLPGSHSRGPLTTTEVRAARARGGFVPITPRAGDVLIHDVLCVHYSEANRGPVPRSTWYLEFRTMSQLRADSRWPASWARARRAILFHACAARHAAGLAVMWPLMAEGETIEQWLAVDLELRVPHVSHGVDYDVTSPWFHFA